MPNSLIPDAIKDLLEKKHLYQRLTITLPAAQAKDNEALKQLVDVSQKEWRTDKVLPYEPTGYRGGSVGSLCHFVLPAVRLWCHVCDDLQTLSPTWAGDLARPEQDFSPGGEEHPKLKQLFMLAYDCVACKRSTQMFIVRREKNVISLHGRSPMAHVAVPREIPKAVASFYRRASTAFQAGEVLAANFLLRVLIEQFARHKMPQQAGMADEVLDAYVKDLPDAIKTSSPSLRTLYKDLSVDIHSAAGDVQLFERALNEITHHFELRWAHRLDR